MVNPGLFLERKFSILCSFVSVLFCRDHRECFDPEECFLLYDFQTIVWQLSDFLSSSNPQTNDNQRNSAVAQGRDWVNVHPLYMLKQDS